MRECTFTHSEVFETEPCLVGGKIGQLAQSLVRVPVECIDKGCVVQLTCESPKVTPGECRFELAASVEAATLVLSKCLKHLLDGGQGVLEPILII